MRAVSGRPSAFVLSVLALLCGPAPAAPFVPSDDSQVLATVPARRTDPAARALSALRQAWQRAPLDVQAAVRYARQCLDTVAADGDPRHVGHAQAALRPWFSLAEPPLAVRVQRARILQFDHQFAPALADLDAVLRQQPTLGEAWSWRTAILLVQADYAEARRSCEQSAPLATPLIAVACRAQVDSVTGAATAASAALRAAQAQHRDDSPQARLWALTRLAEADERRGAFDSAEAAFREAVALGLADVYLLAAYADFLLDRGRAAEVLALLRGHDNADVLLLRLALAAKASGDASASRHAATLVARFDAARQRGDASHQKEESRFVLAVQGDAQRALLLAQQNFAVQSEPADARILLEAALAARNPAAARPALDWLAASGIQSVALQPLAAALAGPR